MPEGPFMLVARLAQGGPMAREVVRRLAVSFYVQLSPEQLGQGVCVMQAPTRAEAEARVEDVLRAGAGFQIIDSASGAVVAEGQRGSAANATLLGVSSASPPPPPPADAGRGGPTPDEPARFDIDRIDHVDADSLVALDGSTGDEPVAAPPPLAGALSSRTAAPSGSSQHHPRGARSPEPPALPGPMASSPAHSLFAPNDDDTPLQLVDVPRIATSSAIDEPRAPGPPPGARPSSLHSASVRPSSAYGSSARAPRRAPQLPSGLLLLGGKLRSWPRLRILAGFLLALPLGSILPMCHARSVVSSRVEPARQELSRARAYRHLLADQAGYRSPEEIEDYISSIKFRSGTYDLLIWIACSGLIGIAWFRFT